MADKCGRCSLKAFLACVTKAFLSAKNNIRFAQLHLVNISTIAAAVLVFPLPVAITNKAFLLVPLSLF